MISLTDSQFVDRVHQCNGDVLLTELNPLRGFVDKIHFVDSGVLLGGSTV